MIKEKRGSHVGMIASFSIFLLFLISLFFILEPALKNNGDKELTLEYIKLKIMDEFSANLTTIVVTNYTAEAYGYDGLNVSKQALGVQGMNVFAVDKDNNKIANAMNDYSDSVIILYNGGGVPNYTKLYFSEEKFNITNTSITAFSTSFFKVESVVREKQLFESRIARNIANFNQFKGNLSIPQNKEIEVDFTYFNGSIIKSGNSSTLREVYAEDIPITYIDANARNVAGKLTIKLW